VKEGRARKAMVTGMGLGGAIGIFVWGAAYFYGDVLAGIFSKDVAVIFQAADYLKGFAPEAVVTCILFSFMFLGISRSMVLLPVGILMGTARHGL